MTNDEAFMLRHIDIRPGDWIGGGLFSNRHGPIKNITDYHCSPHHNCDPDTCERAAWGVLTFTDGTEMTIEPDDGIFFVDNYIPADRA